MNVMIINGKKNFYLNKIINCDVFCGCCCWSGSRLQWVVEHVNPTSTIIMNTVILLNQLYNYSFHIMKYIAAFLNGTDINKLWTLNKEWADNKRQVLMKGGIICNIHSGINLSNTLVSLSLIHIWRCRR